LAHELRNPLAPLRNGLEILPHCVGPKYDPSIFAEVHGVMTRQLDHMVRLVDDLLDISRIDTGKIALRSERICIKELLDDAVHFVRPHIESAGHELTTLCPSTPSHLEGDRARLVQVLSNLLNNAAKFTPARGRIRI